MATKTTFVATVSVPVYGSWKCAHCGEVNFSIGVIGCKRQVTTTALRKSRQEEARSEAAHLAQSEWASNACAIISDPKNNARSMFSNLTLKSTRCSKCGKRAKWYRSNKLQGWGAICIFPAIFLGVFALSGKAGVGTWLIFLALLAVIAYSYLCEPLYVNMIAKLPSEYMPVLGSVNQELIDFAKKWGKPMMRPEETMEVVKGYGSSLTDSEKRVDG